MIRKVFTAVALSTALITGTGAAFAPSASAAVYCQNFPLPAGHFYGVNDGTVYSHSGVSNSTDRRKVANIQKILRFNGINVTVDGIYGLGTRAGVAAYQRKFNLYPDGRVGPMTWYSMAVRASFTPDPGLMCR